LSTLAVTLAPAFIVPRARWPMWMMRSASFCVSVTWNSKPSPVMRRYRRPAAGFGIEGNGRNDAPDSHGRFGQLIEQMLLSHDAAFQRGLVFSIAEELGVLRAFFSDSIGRSGRHRQLAFFPCLPWPFWLIERS
jgi:hypothetical protein